MPTVQQLLTRVGVAFAEHGPNIGPGHIGIKCCFCGDDPSEHLTINVTDRVGVWHCWRCDASGGVFKLFKKLAPHDVRGRLYDDLKALRKSLPRTGKSHRSNRPIGIPASWKPLTKDTPLHWNYLVERGFPERDVEKVVERYRLFADTKDWRVIFPVLYDAEMVTFTGRAISKHELTRYKTQPQEQAKMTTGEMVYNYDNAAKGGKTLCVVEGPMDCLKIDFYGRKEGVRAIALFGKSLKEKQGSLIRGLREHYEQTVLLFDQEERFSPYVMQRRQLPYAKIGRVKGGDDPGDLSPLGVRRCINHNFWIGGRNE